MTLRAAVSSALAQAVGRVSDELTAQLQAQARDEGVPAGEAASLIVVFQDGFEARSDSEAYLEREYGRPGGQPPLALLRRFNRDIELRAAPLLDQHAGRLLEGQGLL